MVAADRKAEAVSAPKSISPESQLIWKQLIKPVEPFLRQVSDRLNEQIEAFDPELITYAQYALSSQGKQIRPALVALSGSACGELNDSHVSVAAIIEMVHLATLAHDDVMDQAELRRQRPTLAASWGNQASVLIGDCLFAHALKMAASFPTPLVCRSVSSATHVVCSGEILQNKRRRDFELSEEEYLKIIRMKTAELFALSCDLGASVAGADEAAQSQLREYWACLGMAYQIYDDCLDLFGSESWAGKSLGTDLAEGKLTLPLLIALKRANESDRRAMIGYLEEWQPGNAGALLDLASRYQAHEGALEALRQHLRQAEAALEALPASESRDALGMLTEFLFQQTGKLRLR